MKPEPEVKSNSWKLQHRDCGQIHIFGKGSDTGWEGEQKNTLKNTPGHRAYFALPYIFICKNVHPNNKIRIYKTIIVPIVTYGSETWVLDEKSAEQVINLNGNYLEECQDQFKKLVIG